ncbi:P-loop containing nucleoside triphosphate hydrolase protein [Lasiosphaeria hispida]|uniref:P-loop containing nucleoside triphosphate hydrolase protein n=1 Tax=Lasiosphaeria hispida TaxID=260671 RepID=A0AAJ0H506_9PEZI|nr:P-loop containing nucleoside triphosphate hydrolase protein [Lasiosphaeria hispida]
MDDFPCLPTLPDLGAPFPRPVPENSGGRFVKPPRASKAIPIINPLSGQPFATPTKALSNSPKALPTRARAVKEAQKESEKKKAQAHAALAAQFARAKIEQAHAAGADSQNGGQMRHPLPQKPPQPNISNDGDASEPAELDVNLDVYATPFVPSSIQIINTLPGRVHHTFPVRDIDFSSYARSALGHALLPAVPTLDSSYFYDAVAAKNPLLTPLGYEEYFRFHLENEMQHQAKENQMYSLYAHEGVIEFLSDKQAKVTIVVPGLRENTPYLEEDDIVELRQLRADKEGRLVEGGFYGNTITSASWTENIYLTRVTAVVRATETVVLLASDLTLQASEVLLGHLPDQMLPPQHTLRFNMQFPVMAHRAHPMMSVLPQIQASLCEASHITKQISHIMRTAAQDSLCLTNKYWLQSMLFPTEADCNLQANAHSGILGQEFLDNLLNVEQSIAVSNVCAQNYGVLPYLISGPPGTGKTKTMIEIALQLINNVSTVSHILVCAPSDPAADTLANRLRSFVKPDEMLRLNRPTRTFEEVPDTLLPYCSVSGDMFSMPSFQKLMSYKMVVTTCRDASMLLFSRLSNTDLHAVEYGLRAQIHPTAPAPTRATLHWSALLIDEAAQATEPGCLVPLWVVCPPASAPEVAFTPLLVMAGDEHQLNPRTSLPHSPLSRSLFARLFARPVYADHPLARRFRAAAGSLVPPDPLATAGAMLRPAFTNLVRNYRSHPAILAVPSALFYADTLIPSADPAAVHRLAAWPGWANPALRWPVLFHDNASPDELEREGGGWRNAGEAALACEYARRFVAEAGVQQEEVCVMSPFKAQVRVIRKMMRAQGLWGVNVGPAEAFQGLEYGVVILCVTRARSRFVARDRKWGWGVLRMPNLMNVALTRAKFGLVVLGCRGVLVAEDENWKAVVEFCDRNGLSVGEGRGEAVGERTLLELELLKWTGVTLPASG